MKSFILAALVLLVCSVSVPINVSAQAPPTITTAKADSIRALMEVTGVMKMTKDVMAQMIMQFQQTMPNVPDRIWAELIKSESIDELVAELVPIYDRHYSQEEINGLLAFYRSDLGQRVLAKMPLVMQESMSAGQVWGEKVMEQLLEKLEQKGYKHS